MVSIIIFGTGITANKVTEHLNNDTNVVAFLDNNKEKWGRYFKNKSIDSPYNIFKYKYDYIIIASEYNDEIYKQLLSLGINNKIILQFYVFIDLFNNYIDNSIKKIIKYKYNGIITGISYSMIGINKNILNEKFIKLAFPSQDLFYDYNLVKYVMGNKKQKLQYVIIGLSYYSFEYDLSLSSMKDKVILYKNILGYEHNFKGIKIINQYYNTSKKIAKKIFNNIDSIKFSYNSNFDLSKNKEYLGKYHATLDCNKNYPNTVKENIEILEEYLDLLIKNNIKPILVVCPVTKYYSKNFNLRIKKEYFNIITKLKGKYDFQYLDYFRSEEFEDCDFNDVSHLNENGAIKFTKMLNKLIKW